ncbi:MAG: hypothetical protein GY820_22675 [Gammaproteobacteria bacterium]|nr:hypothetical protein [Gammaproteobacteria bacterium]
MKKGGMCLMVVRDVGVHFYDALKAAVKRRPRWNRFIILATFIQPANRECGRPQYFMFMYLVFAENERRQRN